MDWDNLRYVLAIVRCGTLQKAGKQLGVAHTTVGRRLRSLEDRLGVRLFDRTPEGLVVTAAGADIAAVAQEVEDEILAVEGRVLGRDAVLRGSLRVSTVDTLFWVFDEAFASFIARHPTVELAVATSRVPASLMRREADVVIRLSNAPPDTLFGRRIGVVQFALYGSLSLVERVGVGAPLNAFPWIGWTGGENLEWFHGWLADNAPGANIVLRLDYQGLTIARAIRAGIGVQILPCFLGDPDQELTRIAPLDSTFQLALWLLTLPELRSNRRVRAFLDHMADALVPQRALLAGELASHVRPEKA